MTKVQLLGSILCMALATGHRIHAYTLGGFCEFPSCIKYICIPGGSMLNFLGSALMGTSPKR